MARVKLGGFEPVMGALLAAPLLLFTAAAAESAPHPAMDHPAIGATFENVSIPITDGTSNGSIVRSADSVIYTPAHGRRGVHLPAHR